MKKPKKGSVIVMDWGYGQGTVTLKVDRVRAEDDETFVDGVVLAFTGAAEENFSDIGAEVTVMLTEDDEYETIA